MIVATRTAQGQVAEDNTVLISGFKGVRTLSADTLLSADDAGWLLLCVGTHMHTLPTSLAGLTYFFKNVDTGVITIVGTVDGDAGGYKLVNPWQLIQITGDGNSYYVTGTGSS